MLTLKNISIGRKQMLIIMLISLITLLLACVALVGVDTLNFRAALSDEISTMTQIAGNNCAAALDFNDPKAAEGTLEALRAEPPIAKACVYNRQGEVYAVYQRDGNSTIAEFPPVQPPGREFRNNQLRVFLPITMEGEKVGTIYVTCDLYERNDRLRRSAVIAMLVLGISLLAAFFLSMRLQRVISGPVLQLAQAVRTVTLEKNYAVRATKQSNDELGQLVDGFNEMLAQIQQRDAALQSARDGLEMRVTERTTELAKTNEALQVENVERKRAEEMLRASQQILEGIINAIPVRVFWKDKNLTYLGCNAVFARDAGFADPKDIIGKDDYQMGWRDQADLYRGDDRQVIESGCSKLFIEEPQTTPEGNTITLLSSKLPLRSSKGEISGILGTYMDITERKQAEAALRSSEERFRIAAETANDVIYEWDLKQSLEWLGKIDEMLGYEPGEFPRTLKGWAASVHPEDLERTMAAIQAHLKERVPFAIEYRVRRKDGVYRWWSARGAVARTPDGEPTRWIGSITDITERKQAEERLTQERDLSEGILNSMPGLFYLITEKGRFLRWNRQLETVSGYSGEEIARMHALDIFPAEHKGLVAEQILQVFKTGCSKTEADLLTKQGGRLPFYFTGGTVIVDGQPCLAGAGIDITERKRLEARFLQSQKMETVGKLAGGIAHEFNSILTAIIGQSELLLGDLPAGSPLVKSATEISKAAERAATLTRQLLAYGRKQILQPEALDLNRVIARMEGMFHHLMGVDVVTQIVTAAGLKAVRADAGQIEQVIVNMALNARDAMPNGGKLTLETANVSFDQESVGRDAELKPGDYVMLAITDTGAGMSAEVRAHVFEPFFTTKGVGQGTGLGLSTCYGIIKQSGGHISVYSEPARGTTFKIYLPQVEQPTKIPIQGLNSPDLPSGTETILLVEDDPALREMAATLLTRLGYTVLAAADGLEALSLTHQKSTGYIDLLFTDVVMPQMSGKELSDRIHALHPNTKILFTSAYTESAIVHQGALNPGVELLQKPFTPSALARKVREVLDGKNGSGNESCPLRSDASDTPVRV